MNKYIKKTLFTICILVVICIIVIYRVFIVPHIPEGAEILPETVLMEEHGPNNTLIGQILAGEKIEGFNPLGSNERYYLSIKYPNSQYLVLRDLSEGFGSYEGGMMGLKWLDSEHILIERIVGDQKADLVFDIENQSWKESENN